MADKRVQLALVIHNHQPVGNFDHVIAEACEKAYLPFLRMLLEFPRIRIGLHTSGCLLEWMEQGCPEYFELVRELLKRGQLELLGGGMYEPILPILPERDALWQLERMNGYLEEQFGRRPRGMWLAERVWEPHLPKVIAAAGLDYTLLDDFHFRGCAMPEQVATGYFTTRHATSSINLFPISEKLRYTLPFQPPAATFDHLRRLADETDGSTLQVFGDDGEKFGVWPDTYDWVYGKGWLCDFLTALTESLDWINLSLPEEVLENRQPAGSVYIPCASYKEMGEWTRIDPDARSDDPPGHWRNYLTKYSEAQALYERMLGVSVEAARELPTLQPDLRPRIEFAARTFLARAQCNCAYWHGVFGGLYLNNLRHALNYELLRAERFLPGFDDQALRSEALRAELDPARGLVLSRLDQYDPPFVWTNVLTRRKEHYHHKLTEHHENDEHASIHDRVVVKEEGLEDRLVYDGHPRASFNCYLAPPVESSEQFLFVSKADKGSWRRSADDYGATAQNLQRSAAEPRVVSDSFEYGASASSGSVQLGPLELRKSATLHGSELRLRVEGAGSADPRRDNLLWVEFNFNVLTDQADNRYLIIDTERLRLSEPLLCDGATGFTLCDGWQQRQLRLTCSALEQLVVYPIYTVSSSEGGFERTYQGSCFMLGYARDTLESGISITINVEELGHAG